QAGHEFPHSRGVQRRFLRSREPPDLRIRDPSVRWPRELRAPADDRSARYGVPAPERPLLLALADRRADDAGKLPGAGGFIRHRLDRLRAVIDDDADRAAVLLDRGPVRGLLLDLHRAQLPSDDHHDAGPWDELLPHAAAGVGQL